MGLKTYIAETRGEFKHVAWPTKKQAVMYALLVVAISLFISFFLFLFDTGYLYVLENYIIK